MKKILSLCLTLVLCLCAFGSSHAELLTDEDVTITIALSEQTSQPIYEDAPTVLAAEAATGINIEYIVIPQNDYNTKLTAMYAAGQLPDIFMPSFVTSVRELVEAGAVLPLNDLLAEYAPSVLEELKEIPDLTRTMIDGEFYTLPIIRRDVNREVGLTPFIRMDLLEANNIPVPTTWEDLVDVLRQLHELYPDMVVYSNNGYARVIGTDYLSLTRALGAEYNAYLDDNGVWQLGRIEDRYKTVLEFVHQMYVDGILDPEYLTNSWSTVNELGSSGKLLFWYQNNSLYSTMQSGLKAVDPTARFEPLPMLEGLFGEKSQYRQPTHYFDNWAFSANTENPEVLAKFINWLYGEEATLLFNWGIEGETYEMVDGQPQWIQSFVDEQLATDDPYYGWQSKYGIGYPCFPVSWLFAHTDAFTVTDDSSLWSQQEFYDLYKDENILDQPVYPPLTLEQAERITEIEQEINDYSITTVCQFISGDLSLDEWDNYVQHLKDNGADEMIQILNEAEAAYQEMLAQMH